jgi:hypothetical protein
MAMALQPFRPVAPWPLGLGGGRTRTVAALLETGCPPPRRMCARGAVAWRPRASRCSLVIMPARRWGHAWRSVACSPCSSLASLAPRFLLPASGRASIGQVLFFLSNEPADAAPQRLRRVGQVGRHVPDGPLGDPTRAQGLLHGSFPGAVGPPPGLHHDAQPREALTGPPKRRPACGARRFPESPDVGHWPPDHPCRRRDLGCN